jgi:hypothetical protein
MMTAYRFDDRNIRWQKLGDFEHFVYTILDIDRVNNIADVMFKFEPHKPIVLHRHKVTNKTLVIQGEHRIYGPNGDLKEIRPVGRYTSSPANLEPHRECGGDEGAVVFFSIRDYGGEGVLYELLDDQQNLIGTLTMENLIDLHEVDKSLS